jgi:hypothetical protein
MDSSLVGYACSHGLFPMQYVSCSPSSDPFPTSSTYLFHPLHYRRCYYLRIRNLRLSLPSSWVPRFCPPSLFLGPAFPVGVPRCLACLVLQTRSAMMRFPFLVCMSRPPPQPSAHAAAPSLADRDDEVPIPLFSHRTTLVSCYGDAEVPLLRPDVSCHSSSACPAGSRLMPSRAWLTPIGLFFFSSFLLAFAPSLSHRLAALIILLWPSLIPTRLFPAPKVSRYNEGEHVDQQIVKKAFLDCKGLEGSTTHLLHLALGIDACPLVHL